MGELMMEGPQGQSSLGDDEEVLKPAVPVAMKVKSVAPVTCVAFQESLETPMLSLSGSEPITAEQLREITNSFAEEVMSRGNVYETAIGQTTEVYLADVDEGLARFRAELNIAQHRGNQVICASIGAGLPVPVDSRSIMAAIKQEQVFYRTPLPQGLPWLDSGLLSSIVQSVGLKASIVEREQARKFFGEHLRSFLYSRFLSSAFSGGMSAGPRGPIPSNMLHFRVHAKNPGLRIRSSPAYLLGTGTVFGAPSTPVDGWLRPGAYFFGGEDSSGVVTWDTGIYRLPPATEAHLVAV